VGGRGGVACVDAERVAVVGAGAGATGAGVWTPGGMGPRRAAAAILSDMLRRTEVKNAPNVMVDGIDGGGG
jgi:hypothetical protein